MKPGYPLLTNTPILPKSSHLVDILPNYLVFENGVILASKIIKENHVIFVTSLENFNKEGKYINSPLGKIITHKSGYSSTNTGISIYAKHNIVTLTSKRIINKGEEITTDYGGIITECLWYDQAESIKNFQQLQQTFLSMCVG